MMNYYQPTQAGVDYYEHINYIETYINLFVEFYNKFSDLDLTHIKTIIRPNNVDTPSIRAILWSTSSSRWSN